MNKLKQTNNSFQLTKTRPFNPTRAFSQNTINTVFKFAYAMTFGEGEHRDHRTGGSLNRKKGQIFINTFQGKLSELAIYNFIYQLNRKAYDKLSEPDFDVYGLGNWDDSDISLENIKFSVKSTKYYGNLLLLETQDWNSNAEYIPNLKSNKNFQYDYFILVRIKPDSENIMKSHRLLYANDIDKEKLENIIHQQIWEYDIAGYISNEDLKALIKNGFTLPKGSLLNGKVQMDAENYYIQSGDMKNFEQLVINL